MRNINGSITFLGDTHGRHEGIRSLCQQTKGTVFHVGDMGIGFRDNPEILNSVPNLVAIHGNHDSPERCKLYNCYLGRFGVLSWNDEPLFYCSGAWSIDHAYRTPGLNWWADEELSEEEMTEATELYRATKPKYVVTHDCPECLWPDMIKQVKMLFGDEKIPTRTGKFLDRLLAIHQPIGWLYGHYHGSCHIIKNGTYFRCLNVGETLTL